MSTSTVIKISIPNPLRAEVPKELERYILVRVAADLLDAEARRLLAMLRDE